MRRAGGTPRSGRADTVGGATDAGVYSTRTVGRCVNPGSSCWAPVGAGMPMAPVVALSASPVGITPGVLVAGTYGRGVWQIPLLTDVSPLTTASASPSTLTFATQTAGSISPAQTVTVRNTGTVALTLAPPTVAGDFGETENCSQASIAPGASCAIQWGFSPTQAEAGTGHSRLP